ncbi:hypothetical protein SSP24_07140 [Streptomyces spinoverrucosus]|uniref:Uncharacterized protein n=1 Tax=Streptomyces spinoverrucosus TaxID=284043 RepID=A0A4Y3VBJ3_9ACTN|nr:hypothetical protein SSP24_07140 [Streptomyces spinoverrucosus]GHB38489.1 hypothetical protein GCM10010397_05430 [Streptomyces spinoverrucosus]
MILPAARSQEPSGTAVRVRTGARAEPSHSGAWAWVACGRFRQRSPAASARAGVSAFRRSRRASALAGLMGAVSALKRSYRLRRSPVSGSRVRAGLRRTPGFLCAVSALKQSCPASAHN